MTIKTNALRLLDAAGVTYVALPYAYDAAEFSAEEVATQLGRANVFKTLVVTAPDPLFAVIPAGTDLDLKRLATIVGSRRASMAPLAEVEALTGYQRGAVTVLGAKKPLPVVLDEMALADDEIAVSAGARGLQVVLSTDDYRSVTGAVVADIAR